VPAHPVDAGARAAHAPGVDDGDGDELVGPEGGGAQRDAAPGDHGPHAVHIGDAVDCRRDRPEGGAGGEGQLGRPAAAADADSEAGVDVRQVDLGAAEGEEEPRGRGGGEDLDVDVDRLPAETRAGREVDAVDAVAGDSRGDV